jgi:hypothetical protein
VAKMAAAMKANVHALEANKLKNARVCEGAHLALQDREEIVAARLAKLLRDMAVAAHQIN